MASESHKYPTVSIILPTWNGEEDLKRLLPAIAVQDYAGEIEICAVDSSSSDCSVELLREAGIEVRIIPQSEFGHGRTRNLCAERAKGEFLVFLSQDVVPQEDFVRRLLEPFHDERVAGVYGRVLPFPDDDPLTARTVLSLPEASEKGSVRDLDALGGVWNLDAYQRARYLRFNNVASAIRTSVFREIPFPETSFGEDFAWAARALTWGWRIAYVPDALAYHAHSYTLSGAFERYRVDARFHRETHAHLIRPNLRSVLRGIVYEVREDLRYVRRSDVPHKLRFVLRSPWLRTAMVLGQYAGSRGE
ncbi:MAG TPA: glycosyltransferase [Planctomycetaceae bacterium]|nr:glycosyltransferase [Planctomycetaceae bacterium]